MTLSYLRNIFFLLDLFVVFVLSEGSNETGQAITTRFWDCCKPSCSWNGKASFTHPVDTCNATDSLLTDFTAGTGCNGGSAYTCSDQHPWSVNDTFSYGFAGIFLLNHPQTEASWCCACYQLDFTSDSLKGKTMIVQASNTAYDVNTANRFSLAVNFQFLQPTFDANRTCRSLGVTLPHMTAVPSNMASSSQCSAMTTLVSLR